MPETGSIATWLEGLGLGRYAAMFAQNDVDIALLGDLTAEDLREMGVSSVGHRRSILSAAARLRQGHAQSPQPEAAMAEQRMVTAMFCDLVGSTQLSTELEPEDYRDVIVAFRATTERALAQHHGYADRFLGDGIVAFFGLEGGQDHAAEHAVAAGLNILTALHDLSAIRGHKLRVRIGLATGLTVIAGQNDGMAATKDGVVGETPNLAARLQAAAEPDTILISQATRDRLGDLFVLVDKGTLALKGMQRDLRAWQVLGHAQVGSRFEALRATATSAAFVGRKAELALLVQQRDRPERQGRLTVTLISGDSGMGKSRLAREGMAAGRSMPDGMAVLQCTPYHTATPLLPLRRFLDRRLAGARSAIAPFLNALGINDPDAPELLAGFLSETAMDAPRAAHARRLALLTLLTRILGGIGAAEGVMLIEDVHWLDPTTAELLSRLGTSGTGGGWHLIATTRQRIMPEWGRATGAEMITLDRLPQMDLLALIRAVAEAKSPGTRLTDAETEEIALRCDSNPVFAEELTRFWLERPPGTAREIEPALPASLSDSLMSRLDRLVEGRQLVQIASVIGMEFPVALLIAVSDLPEAEAERGIVALMEADVLRPAQSPLGRSIGFRHMLLQDAAYRTLLRRDRISLHGRIADCMADQFPALAAVLPQVVAHHYSRAARLLEAANAWHAAGQSAARRSAYAEAAAHLRRALDDLGQAAKTGADTAPAELQTRISLAAALIALNGFGAADVRTEMQRVEDLVASLDQSDQLIPLLVPQWAYLGATGQHGASLDVARRILTLASTGSEVDRLLGHRAVGTSLVFAGQLEEAQWHLQTFMDLYDHDRHAQALSQQGASNHAAMTAVGLGEVAVLQGNVTAVARWSAEASRLAAAGGLGHDICNVTMFVGCILPALDGRLSDCAPAAEALAQLSVKHALPLWSGYSKLFRGIAALVIGQVELGHALSEEGIAEMLDAAAFLRFCLVFHAEACLSAGLTEAARRSLHLSGLQADQPDNWLTAEVLRVEAMVSEQESKPASLITSLLARADAVAARQGATRLRQRIAQTRAQMASSWALGTRSLDTAR